jgi:glycosyltransferase involved in cell wall biosynthesis
MISPARIRKVSDRFWSATPHARLFTVWGTVLYVDVDSGELRHGAIESSPANAMLVADLTCAGARRQGWIMHDRGNACDPIVGLPEQCWSISSAQPESPLATPTNFEIVPLERGLLGLQSSALYLSARPDGRLTLSNPWCSTWECFLASDDWCTDGGGSMVSKQTENLDETAIDRKNIAQHIINPLFRTKINVRTRKQKVIFFGPLQWSNGRVYYDLCKSLSKYGYIADILDWQTGHGSYINDIMQFYDLIISALDGIQVLMDIYNVPPEKIIAISHWTLAIQDFIEKKGLEPFAKFAGYGVVGHTLLWDSLTLGVPRVPKVVSLGINFTEFFGEISEGLQTVGYAGSRSVKTKYGVEIKRGELAEQCAQEAGLNFKPAGFWSGPGSETGIHDMPGYYKTVDAVLVTSLTEAAGLPAMEAAAAGKLVISTPVGHFPLKAYAGGGIIAPIETDKFREFTVQTLRFYQENPQAYAAKCREIQEAAKFFACLSG